MPASRLIKSTGTNWGATEQSLKILFNMVILLNLEFVLGSLVVKQHSATVIEVLELSSNFYSQTYPPICRIFKLRRTRKPSLHQFRKRSAYTKPGFLKSCSRSYMSNPKLLLTLLNISQDPISGIIFILCYLRNIACCGFTYHCSSVPSAHDTTGGKVILITNPYQAYKVVLSARTIQIPKLFHATPWYVSLEN